jgi:uncharacterized protein DUF4238
MHFYLRHWTGDDGKLWEYRRGRPARRAGPRETACEIDLYRAAGIFSFDPWTRSIETEFFQKIDNDGARVLQKLVSTAEVAELTREERGSWALFLNALHERSAHRIAAGTAAALKLGEELKNEMLAAQRDPESRKRFQDAFDVMSNNRVLAARLHLESMVKSIEDPETMSFMLNLTWRVLSVAPGFELLTSDKPLLVNFGTGGEPQVITLAISPRHLFVLMPESDSVDGKVLEKIIRAHCATLRSNSPDSFYSLNALDPETVEQLFQEDRRTPPGAPPA